MADIFLSYARQDSAKAKLLAHALENFGLTVWWDRRLLAGQQFSSEIEREIDGARSVVVLWSDHAAKSRWVRDEASAGADQGKLCPVQIGGGEVPIGFRQFHTIDMKAWAGDADDPTIHELVAQLQGGETTTPPKEPQTSTFEPVLAVLPFENLSSEDEMRFFSDGISDEILTRLMHGSKIKIMGRATTFQYRGDRKGAAAKELACTHLLDGSIRRAGGKVRTTAHLLDIASDQIIWSSRFDDDLNDIFETQDRIAEAIAKALDSEFKRGSDRGIPLDLYDRYLKAKVDTWALETLPVSIEQLRQIAHEAPDFADVWAQLAMWSNYYSYLVPLQEAKHYRAIAKRAIIACDRLEYQGVEPLISQFRSLPPFGSFCDAAPVVAKLQEASTNGPAGRGVLSMHFADIGMLGESLEHAAVGHELDPNDLLAESLFVMSLYWTGDDERAIELMKDYLSQNPANYHVAMTLASCAAVRKDWKTIDQILNPDRLRTFQFHEYSRFVDPLRAIRSGDHTAIGKEARKLISSAAALGAVDLVSLSWIAFMTDADHAYDLVDRVRIGLPKEPTEEFGPSVYGTLSLFIDSLPKIREDPGFPILAARLGLAQYWAQNDRWPDCADRLEKLYPFREGCIDAARTVEVDSFYPPRN